MIYKARIVAHFRRIDNFMRRQTHEIEMAEIGLTFVMPFALFEFLQVYHFAAVFNNEFAPEIMQLLGSCDIFNGATDL